MNVEYKEGEVTRKCATENTLWNKTGDSDKIKPIIPMSNYTRQRLSLYHVQCQAQFGTLFYIKFRSISAKLWLPWGLLLNFVN